ncbi:hypothetical protein [Streptomyces sp. NPDC060194]|uniref:hypothetical protein n=1 Tax=Streptomyces sp. NPDC060194 TaxID=3347069 RepID=UPI0036519944
MTPPVPVEQCVPVPLVVLVLLDGQELTAALLARRETADGWRYRVVVPLYRNPGPVDAEEVEAATYSMWVRPPRGTTSAWSTARIAAGYRPSACPCPP